ncbi:methyltransferase [Asanoa ishikariensis]|uniref:class I SAM-dependent methyltransferase n=1 Tax=Asanoa ishikariensis TaxID=137265 RepID=UPI0015A2F2EB|nr:class I SAM-dependent methyltransferase [Asanoa ishikariensis]GIF69393.1 methyltransferase [Asanoa ishikariensis]
MTGADRAVEQYYTALAATYWRRPPYAPRAVDRIVQASGRRPPVLVADVGAGTGHLTFDLLTRGCLVHAVEPNDAMRAVGMARIGPSDSVTWSAGTGERTGLTSGHYDLVTYGSSLDDTDRPRAIREAARILKPDGWLACAWNRRVLNDPLQAEVEALIRSRAPEYGHRRRSRDHARIIGESGFFHPPRRLQERLWHTVAICDWITAWRSHVPLQRRAGAAFDAIVDEIERLVRDRVSGDELAVPYATVGWLAPVRDLAR